MGTKAIGVVVKGVALTVTGYMVYRLQGGPPIGKVVKAFRKLRADERLAKSQRIELNASEFKVA